MPLPAPRARHRTKQEFVYHTLRDAIMEGTLRPGERLVIGDLAHSLKVSAIPVREALQMLQSEGLIVSRPHAGATVAPVTLGSVRDVFAVLEGLETVAAGLVAEQASREDLDALGRLVARMDSAVAADQPEQWAALNTEFHLTMARLAGLPMLAETTERAVATWNRVRSHYFRGVLAHRIDQAQREHRAILAALRARDAAGVRDLVGRHNREALQAYMSYLEGRPGEPDESPAEEYKARAVGRR